jgi:hypothetical protein
MKENEPKKDTLKNFCMKAIESYKNINCFGVNEDDTESVKICLEGCSLKEHPELILDVTCEVRKKDK